MFPCLRNENQIEIKLNLHSLINSEWKFYFHGSCEWVCRWSLFPSSLSRSNSQFELLNRVCHVRMELTLWQRLIKAPHTTRTPDVCTVHTARRARTHTHTHARLDIYLCVCKFASKKLAYLMRRKLFLEYFAFANHRNGWQTNSHTHSRSLGTLTRSHIDTKRAAFIMRFLWITIISVEPRAMCEQRHGAWNEWHYCT